MMSLQRRAGLLVTPSNQGHFTEVVVFDQNFERQLSLAMLG